MNNLLVIARFELLKLFFTRRGCLSLVAFILVWAVLLRYLIYNATNYLLDPNALQMIRGFIGNSGVQHLLDWPVAEFAVFWGLAVYLLPFFCIVLTADQTASDRSRGTLRLVNLRATRDTIFFGRFVGQMLVQAVLVLAIVGSVILLAVARDPGLLMDCLSLALLVCVNLFIVLLPYTALMALVSTISKSARQATVYAVILWLVFVVLVNWLAPMLPQFAFIDWIMPGSQISELLRKEHWDTLSLAHIPLIQTTILLATGRYMMRKADL